MVLTNETVGEIPDLVKWADANEVEYVIATHLFHYGGTVVDGGLFNPNAAEAVAIFNDYSVKAASKGVRLDSYLASFLKFRKTAADHQVLQLVDEMQQEARAKGIHVHIQSLLQHANGKIQTIEHAFNEARQIADQCGIELFLPPLQAHNERSCPS